jgi:hypothetical protein
VHALSLSGPGGHDDVELKEMRADGMLAAGWVPVAASIANVGQSRDGAGIFAAAAFPDGTGTLHAERYTLRPIRGI